MSKYARALYAYVTLTLILASTLGGLLIALPAALVVEAQTTEQKVSLSSNNLNPLKVLEVRVRGDFGDGPLTMRVVDADTKEPIELTWADGTTEMYFLAYRVATNLYVAYLLGPSANYPRNPYPPLSPRTQPGAFARVVLEDRDRGKSFSVELVGTDYKDTFTYDTVKMTLTLSPKEFAYRREEATITLTISDMDLNLDPTSVETLDPSGINATLIVYKAVGGEISRSITLRDLAIVDVRETGVNTGVFITKTNIRTINTLIAPDKVSDGDRVVIVLLATSDVQGWDDYTVPDQRGSDYAKAVYRPPTVRVTFTSQSVVIEITSPDDNVDPDTADTLDPGASVSLALFDEYYVFYKTITVSTALFRETGRNTGVFRYVIPVSWGDEASVSATSVVLQTRCRGPFYFFVRYYVTTRPPGYNIDARGTGVYTPAVASLEVVKATPRAIIFNVVDRDLNNRADAIEYLVPSFNVEGRMDITLSKPGDIAVARLVLLDTRGNVVGAPLGVSARDIVSFVETDMNSEVFELRINATRLWLTPGAQYILRYYDYTGELDTVFKDYVFTVSEISMTLDRTTIPVNRDGVYIYIRYVNDLYNSDPTRRDSVIVSIRITAADGTPIYDGSTVLTETGINTGVFARWWLAPASVFATPRIIDAKIEVWDPNYQDIKAEGRFRAHDASIEVSATVVKWGDTVTIKVKDPDANRITGDIDYIDVTIMYGNIVLAVVQLEETAPNSAEFVGSVTVSWDNPAFINIPPTAVLTVRYLDRTPIMSPTSPSWTEVPYVATFRIASTDGVLTVKTAVEGYLGVLEELRLDSITVVDPDMNYYKLRADELRGKLAIAIEGVPQTPTYDLVETEADSGKFVLPSGVSISLARALQDAGVITGTETPRELAQKLAAYVGKKVAISYIDDYSAAGTRNIVTQVLVIRAWSAEITTDKVAVNLGEWLTITIKNYEIAGTTISAYRQVIVKSTSYPAGLMFYAEEVSPGVFQLKIQVVKVEDWIPGAKQIPAKLGDVITIEYVDPVAADGSANVLVTKTVNVGVYVEMPGKAERVKTYDVVTGAEVKPRVGKEVFLTVTIKNTDIVERAMTVIVVVRDPNGVAVARFAASVTLAAGASTDISFGWIPIVSGNHTVEVYIVKSMMDRTPVGEPATFTVSVE
ncbi:MAG: hypothetical protein QXS63_02530 [Zestosphaera sp.]